MKNPTKKKMATDKISQSGGGLGPAQSRQSAVELKVASLTAVSKPVQEGKKLLAKKQVSNVPTSSSAGKSAQEFVSHKPSNMVRSGKASGSTEALKAQLSESESRLAQAQADFATLRSELRNQFVLNQSYKRMLIDGSRTTRFTLELGDVFEALRRSITRGPLKVVHELRDLRALRASPLFDPAHYRKSAGIAANVDPIRHYYYVGSSLGHDPSTVFSGSRYLNRHSDVAVAGKEPLSHFLRNGIREGREPLLAAANITLSGADSDNTQAPDAPHREEWIVARLPHKQDGDLQKYDIRPDDQVPREAEIGEYFGVKYRLQSKKPNFKGAVEAIEANLTKLTSAQNPVVSIVIPVYGQLGYTLNTLHALSLQKTKYSFEVIVGDDCSPDETEEFLKDLPGIRFVRHSENGGFIINCNASAKLARGKYLVLLNNDTRVVHGWLDELIDSFKIFPNAGLVGSKLFYPDGTLQEAGGIIWNDGSGWNYGRNDDPNRPEYCYARQVDFISGASIATPLTLWNELGGFDDRYRPAYYEDSDYAFRVREAGFETWFQPLSRVIHYEGKTSGTDLYAGAKAYQLKNAIKFFDRWKGVLKEHSSGGFLPAREKDRYSKRKVLVLDATTPTPDQDAGSVTAVKVMQVFQSLGYQVTFVPADNFLYQRRYIDDLHRIGIECLYAPFVSSLKTHLFEITSGYDLVHVFRHMVMDNALADIRAHLPRVKLMFNNVDLHYLRVQRQGVVEGNTKLIRFAAASKPHELQTMRAADYVFVPSSVEKDLLVVEDGLPTVEVMPFMVDLQEPLARTEPARDILFLGGFDHSPNGDAVEWFMANVWPQLESDKRIRRFVIVGAKPPEHIKAMANERVIVTGRVEDLVPVFEQARAMVVPLRYGAGVKGKIYTALTYGTPVITTAIGAEGIVGLIPGKDVVMAESAQEFVAAIQSVFESDDVFEELSKRGPAFIKEFATLCAGRRTMIEALNELGLPPSEMEKAAQRLSAQPGSTSL